MSLRIEKGYGSWGREYSPEYWPQEASLDRLVKMDKGPFLNRDAFDAVANNAPRERLMMLDIDATSADANGGEPIFLADGTPAGYVTSGAYGHSVGKSLALGYIKSGCDEPGAEVSVAILGKPHRAVLLSEPPFDPHGERLRL